MLHMEVKPPPSLVLDRGAPLSRWHDVTAPTAVRVGELAGGSLDVPWGGGSPLATEMPVGPGGPDSLCGGRRRRVGAPPAPPPRRCARALVPRASRVFVCGGGGRWRCPRQRGRRGRPRPARGPRGCGCGGGCGCAGARPPPRARGLRAWTGPRARRGRLPGPPLPGSPGAVSAVMSRPSPGPRPRPLPDAAARPSLSRATNQLAAGARAPRAANQRGGRGAGRAGPGARSPSRGAAVTAPSEPRSRRRRRRRSSALGDPRPCRCPCGAAATARPRPPCGAPGPSASLSPPRRGPFPPRVLPLSSPVPEENNGANSGASPPSPAPRGPREGPRRCGARSKGRRREDARRRGPLRGPLPGFRAAALPGAGGGLGRGQRPEPRGSGRGRGGRGARGLRREAGEVRTAGTALQRPPASPGAGSGRAVSGPARVYAASARSRCGPGGCGSRVPRGAAEGVCGAGAGGGGEGAGRARGGRGRARAPAARTLPDGRRCRLEAGGWRLEAGPGAALRVRGRRDGRAQPRAAAAPAWVRGSGGPGVRGCTCGGHLAGVVGRAPPGTGAQQVRRPRPGRGVLPGGAAADTEERGAGGSAEGARTSLQAAPPRGAGPSPGRPPPPVPSARPAAPASPRLSPSGSPWCRRRGPGAAESREAEQGSPLPPPLRSPSEGLCGHAPTPGQLPPCFPNALGPVHVGEAHGAVEPLLPDSDWSPGSGVRVSIGRQAWLPVWELGVRGPVPLGSMRGASARTEALTPARLWRGSFCCSPGGVGSHRSTSGKATVGAAAPMGQGWPWGWARPVAGRPPLRLSMGSSSPPTLRAPRRGSYSRRPRSLRAGPTRVCTAGPSRGRSPSSPSDRARPVAPWSFPPVTSSPRTALAPGPSSSAPVGDAARARRPRRVGRAGLRLRASRAAPQALLGPGGLPASVLLLAWPRGCERLAIGPRQALPGGGSLGGTCGPRLRPRRTTSHSPVSSGFSPSSVEGPGPPAAPQHAEWPVWPTQRAPASDPCALCHRQAWLPPLPGHSDACSPSWQDFLK
ncbi:unnamed protein product [Nyctereutes procyonoides]|uniref:(raccoon dog) hypothetical protein n=1 Tax=Nyctereutes procyonoides TaxID=34880 RepID=A0A811ZD88_NYCPR|nr:unnamed protein product [Nyctereutes procyonoides]